MSLSVSGRDRRGRCAGLLEQWLNGLPTIYQDLIINIDAGIPKSGGT